MACRVGGSGAFSFVELCAGNGLSRVVRRTAARRGAPYVEFAVTVTLGRVTSRCRAVAILGIHVVLATVRR
eukprot:1143841-Pyramimonas_sp.AAC.1